MATIMTRETNGNYMQRLIVQDSNYNNIICYNTADIMNEIVTSLDIHETTRRLYVQSLPFAPNISNFPRELFAIMLLAC